MSHPRNARDPRDERDPREHRDPRTPGPALRLLAAGIDSFAPYLRPSGELHDPVFGEPTQYGTAYHALGNAVLAANGPTEHRAEWADRARRGLRAALAHTADPSLPAAGSGFDPATGAVSRGNHRDFTWPPILKAYRLLRGIGALTGAEGSELGERIAAVDIGQSFGSRPPSNWASVWMSGEWIRIIEGLSAYTVADLDDWLEPFFAERIDLDLGFYREPGLPNSYDLFTRYHLADLVAEGYDGRWWPELDRLGETGLRRSLAVQMSDGSLASAHRSTGQTWTLGAQVAYFTHMREAGAAARAFASMRRWQRPERPGDPAAGPAVFSPVENVLPASYRVGYERYTADAHYANLALGFLAVAILHGFTGDEPLPAPEGVNGEAEPAGSAGSVGDPGPIGTTGSARPGSGVPGSTRIENDPTWRAVLHSGRYSAAVNADPAEKYDAFGLTDLTFGPGRLLHWASSVEHQRSGRLLNIGLDIAPVQRTGQLERSGANGIAVDAETADGRLYRLSVELGPDGVLITERAPDTSVLLVPYLRDPGTGSITVVEPTDTGVRLRHPGHRGEERVDLVVDHQIERCIVLENGFANRRGLCGLIRLELAPTGVGSAGHTDDPANGTTELHYRITAIA